MKQVKGSKEPRGRRVEREAEKIITLSPKKPPKHGTKSKSGGKKKERWGHYEDKRNWREYNEKLVKRGEMYISLDFLESWRKELESMNEEKVGAPYHYPESLMTFLGFAYIIFRISYRALEGFLRKLKEYIPQIPAVPDYSQIWRRVRKTLLDVEDTLLSHKDEEVVISLDSSGVKVSNRGEWMREKWKVRRGWIKVHIAVDEKEKQVVALEVTDEKVSDSKKFKPLVEQAARNIKSKGGKLKQANGDGSYDTREDFNTLDDMGVTPGIKMRKNASTKARGSPLRKKHVKEYRELGYEKWRDKYRYGYRWRAEGNLSAVKRLTGEYVRAVKVENMFWEVKMKFLFYNSILKFDATGELAWVTISQK